MIRSQHSSEKYSNFEGQTLSQSSYDGHYDSETLEHAGIGEDDSDSDISDFNGEYSDEVSGSESENLDFSCDERSETSDHESAEGLSHSVISRTSGEALVKEASTMRLSAVRRLIAVYCSIVRQSALTEIDIIDKKTPSKEKKKLALKKAKFKPLKKENSRILKGMSMRIVNSFKESKNPYSVSDVEVYNYVVTETFGIMDSFLRRNTPPASSDSVATTSSLVRRFLSSVIVQLGFTFHDSELCRYALKTLYLPHIMSWIVVMNYINKQFLKIACSLLTGHQQKAMRINCLLFLQQYLDCVKDANTLKIRVHRGSLSSTKIEKISAKSARTLSNELLNFMLHRIYRSQILAASSGRTLKNFGLLKLGQNCIAELYTRMPHANLYTHTFKSIRDLGINVRREWMAASEKKKSNSDVSQDQSSHSMLVMVCSWSFLEAVNIWVTVLTRCREKLDILVYPLVTIITAAIKAKISNARYIPFNLHLITALNQLADGTNKFIPVASCIFQLLEILRIKNIPKIKGKKPFRGEQLIEKSDDIMVKLKLSSKQLHTPQTYKQLYRHLELVLVDHLGLVALHPSFPEFTIPIVAHLKKYVKNHLVDQEFRVFVGNLTKSINASREVIRKKRSSLDVESKPITKLKVFAAEAKDIPMCTYRSDILSRHQELNKEKIVGTMAISEI